MSWLLFSMITLATWGLWAVLQKRASSDLRPGSIAVFQAATTFVLATAAVALRSELNVTPNVLALAMAGGACVFFGNIAFLRALAGGQVSVVVPLTSLYPVVTILLSLAFLGESLGVSQVIGIVLAMLAVVAFSR